MKFRTTVDIPDYGFGINHKSNCIFIGSCFANNIGEKMYQTKIKTIVNPTGIHYNPLSVAKTIDTALSGLEVLEDDVFFANDLWNSFDFHSRFSEMSKNIAITNFNNSRRELKQAIEEASHLFVTFGTSYVYTLGDTGEVVSNCHKLPDSNFQHKFLFPEQIADVWSNTIKQIRQINGGIKVVFTISPIRHWKDGATNNQMSKSSLFIAIRRLLDSSSNENLYYYPSYEIMMDDLRDYRFYADDMLHPSDMAIEYIWEKFETAFFDAETQGLNKKILKAINASKHKVFNSQTQAHKEFCNKMLKYICEIKKDYPHLDFSSEENYFCVK
jgi:hypothetical protein